MISDFQVRTIKDNSGNGFESMFLKITKSRVSGSILILPLTPIHSSFLLAIKVQFQTPECNFCIMKKKVPAFSGSSLSAINLSWSFLHTGINMIKKWKYSALNFTHRTSNSVKPKFVYVSKSNFEPPPKSLNFEHIQQGGKTDLQQTLLNQNVLTQ